MDIQRLITLVSSKPAFRLIGLPDAEKTKAITEYARTAIDRIAMRKDFNFAVGTASTVTVASQSDYTLKGNQDDCREVINIVYGSDAVLLDKVEGVQWDVDIELFESPSTPSVWYELQLDNGFPQVKIIATPSVADETLAYRYRRKNIPIEEFPDEWAFVLVDVIMMTLADVFKDKDERLVMYDFEGKAERSIRDMVNNYRKEGGGTPKRIQIDTVARLANIRRNQKYGYTHN